MPSSVTTEDIKALIKFHIEGHNRYKCPGCKDGLVDIGDTFDDGRPEIENFSLDPAKNFEGIIRLNHDRHTCRSEKIKNFYVCLGCGVSSTQYPSRLRSRYCKCKSEDEEAPSAGDASIEEEQTGDMEFGGYSDAFDAAQEAPASSGETSHDNESQIDTSTLQMDAHALGTAPDNIIGNNSVTDLFSDTGEWPKSSATFFLDEYDKTGNGRKGIVYRTFIHGSEGGGIYSMDDLSEQEMHYHLHTLRTFLDGTASHGKDICVITNHIVSQGNEQKKGALEVQKTGFNEAITQYFQENNIEFGSSVVAQINKMVDEKMDKHQRDVNKEQRINHPTEFAGVRRLYTEGTKSMALRLPIPGVDEIKDCAHIPANQILNHLLALGVEVQWYRAGYEEDWLDGDGRYKCDFTKDMHDALKEMMKNNNKITKETRVVVIRIWSDGFEAHKIKGTNDFNSLQLFTLTLRAPKGKKSRKHTLPFALCFKKENHQEIFIQLLKEVRNLQEVTPRYWGGEKEVIPTIAMTDMCSNDWPERCANCCLSDKGLYHKRWGHSCKFDEKTTPPCRHCELRRIGNLLGCDTKKLEGLVKCDGCLDWWSPGREGVYTDEESDNYPIYPNQISLNHPTKSVHSVRLSFPMVENAVNRLGKWYEEAEGTKSMKKKIATKYLQMIGFSSKLGDAIIKDLEQDVSVLSSVSYPTILKEYKAVKITLKQFGTMPMHMMTLGVEKSNLKLLPVIVNRRKPEQNKLWHNFTEAMQQSQSLINTLSVDWCLSMSFSGKDKQELGTANWQSDHYLAFTRLSLFHFGTLEGMEIPEERKQVLQTFKRLHVVWFCLMSSVFTDDPGSKVTPTRINDLVKVFLTSCNYLWQSLKHLMKEEETLDGDEEATLGGEGSPPDDGEQQPTKKKRKTSGGGKGTQQPTKSKEKKEKKEPFFATKSNYFSLLNLEEMIQYFGDAADSWEGDSESYIQNIKRQIDVLRHNTGFLKTVLSKLLRDHVFAIINEGNPHNHDGYARTHNFRVYKSDEYTKNPSLVLEKEDVVVGVIDSSGKMMICVDNGGGGGISLYEVMFDTNGVERYCLWYCKATLKQQPAKQYERRDLLINDCTDFFLLLKSVSVEEQRSRLSTVICRSWRVRSQSGSLALLELGKNVLLMTDSE